MECIDIISFVSLCEIIRQKILRDIWHNGEFVHNDAEDVLLLMGFLWRIEPDRDGEALAFVSSQVRTWKRLC
jgi:hypothetical protein